MKTELIREYLPEWNAIRLPISILAGFSLFAASLNGQDDADDEEVYELSPFTVDASEDVGYRAATTLAGTRLKSQLRDLGSAISVVTDEMFEDTGAVDASTILSYTLGTEVGGEQGNYSDGLGRNHNGRATQDSQRLDSENSQRVRGLARASLTRDFFLTDIPFDTYNTNRVDISRGANSLLFGIGEPGGVLNNSTHRANATGEDFGEFSIRLGERSSTRATFDIHKVVIDDRLALRFSALHEDFNYQQEPAYEEDKRAYLAIEGILFKNENNEKMGPTKLRASAEIGEIRGTPPNIIPPGDSISSWWALPDATELAQVPGVVIPFYHPQAGSIDPSKVESIPNPDDIFSYSRYHNNLIDPETGGQLVIDSWMPKMVIDSRLGLNPFGNIPFVGDTIGNHDVGIRFLDPNDPSNTVVHAIGSRNGDPTTQLDGRRRDLVSQSFYASQRNGQRVPNFTVPVIMNRNIWDNPNELITGNSNFVSKDFEAYNAVLEQTFLNGDLGIELAFDKQRYQRYGFLPYNTEEVNGDTGMYDVYLDLSTHYANGEPNPNLGRPMMVNRDVNAADQNVTRTTQREAYRATTFYRFDFDDHAENLGRWLGDHTFTAFFNRQTVNVHNSDYSHYWATGGDPDIANRNANAWDRRVRQRVYLGDSVLGLSGPEQVELHRINVPVVNEPGITYEANVWSNTIDGGSAQQYRYTTTRLWDRVSRNKEEIDTEVFSWQGKLLQDHLVILYGHRTDDPTRFENVTRSQLRAIGLDDRFPGGGRDPASAILQSDPVPGLESRDTKTKSAVLHVPNKYMPEGIGLSFHWGESENFNLSSTRRNMYGEVLSPPLGETQEHGFTVSLFDNSLVARLNWYETASTAVTHTISRDANAYNAGAGGIRWWLGRWVNAAETTDFADAVAEVTPDGMTFPFSSYEQVWNEIISWVPPRVQAVRNLRVDASDPANIEILSEPNPGESAVRDTESEGFEVDLTWNIKSNWRLALNVARQEAMQSNTAPVFKEVFDDVASALNSSPLVDFLDSPDLGGEVSFRTRFDGINVPAIQAALAFDNAKVQELREWRYNLVTNYQFAEGAFRGVGLGGAWRWQDESAIGYPNIMTNEGAVVPDVDNPFNGPSESNIDLWASYERPINDRIDWKIQLNIRNAIGDEDYIPVVINPDGNVAVVRNPNPKEFFITNTFSF